MKKNLNKQITNEFLILIVALFLNFGGVTACSSASALKSNNNAKTENMQSESTAANKPMAEKKKIENKDYADAEQTIRIEVFDGRNDVNDISGDKEAPFVREIVRAKQEAIQSVFKDSEFDCSDADVVVEGIAEGSFTKPKSSQVVYLYRKCANDMVKYPGYISGLIITESEEVIAHFVYADIFSGFTSLKILPDINRNGLSEMVLESSFGYGYYANSVDLYEFGEKNPVSLGGTKIFINSSENGEENQSETAYKITVQADKSPVFFREIYQRKFDPEKWQLQAEASVFFLDKGNTAENNFKLLKNQN